VAGTDKGVTSLQMDIKIAGITEEIMRVALDQANAGRLHILGEMAKALTGARTELGEHAPRIETIKIPVDKIREVIGTGGSVIRDIVATSGAKVDIDDDGTIKIAAAKREAIEAALNRIKAITQEPEVGQVYKGKVVKIMEFGAFVNFLGSRDGLVHISELAPQRVKQTGDVVSVGDSVKVKVIGMDDRGKVKLSMKQVDQATGEDIGTRPREEAQAPALRPLRRSAIPVGRRVRSAAERPTRCLFAAFFPDRNRGSPHSEEGPKVEPVRRQA